MRRYVLDENGAPRLEPDLRAWALWFDKADVSIANTPVANDVRVSTVFLGLDHNFKRTGPPYLWETMVFGGRLNGATERYSSREAALAGHERMLGRVLKATKGGAS